MTPAEPTSDNVNNDYFPGEVLEDLRHIPNYNSWILEQFAGTLTGHTAEIGAGLGTISEALRPHVDRLDLIEPSPALAARLRGKFKGDDGCRISERNIESWLETTSSNIFDCVVMVNVLEHIEDDLAAAKGIHSAIKKGGKLLVFVPALPFMFSKLDVELGHFRRYTRRSLANFAEQGGFRVEKLRYFDISGVLPWFLLNTVMGRTYFHYRSLRIYDRVIVPPTKFLEKIIPPPFGKNLVLVASKI